LVPNCLSPWAILPKSLPIPVHHTPYCWFVCYFVLLCDGIFGD
jgi:hypothetical protein